MILAILLCAALFVLLGTMSLADRNEKNTLKDASAYFIAVVSFFALVIVLSLFRSADGASAIQFPGWQLPFAHFSAAVDSLSAFFLIPLLILSLSSSLYGPRYFTKHGAGKTHWFFYGLLIAGMIMVLLARNAVLFILAWELMSLSSFFLVISDKKNAGTIRAGWIYFITAHIGTAFLFALFFLLSNATGSLDFSTWKVTGVKGFTADLVFILAIVAFGLKAGFIPFHVWLPLAHPAAPSHISGIMSGIMIKMGIYGILRILTIIAPYHAWWGVLLIGIGGVSGVAGVLFAIGQHDIKRLLAYHSVENIGIILLGLGLGVIGVVYNCTPVAMFGFAGGLLHVVNHSLFKSLLFLGAGAVIRQTGTGEIDRLGGLLKSMPRTGFLFLVGATAICGLPFFNGFISELMIYAGSIKGATLASQPVLSALSLTVILSLALIGGLAAACFTKVFGIVFLGEPRTALPNTIRDVPASMLSAMWLLAGLCFIAGIGSPLVFPYLIRPVLLFVVTPEMAVDSARLFPFMVTVSIVLGLCALLTIVVGLFMMRLTKKNRPVPTTVTWDCGYCRPDPTMQYTASSFAAPIIHYFKRPLAARRNFAKSKEFFPIGVWTFHSGVDDWIFSKIFIPLFRICDKMFSLLRWFQSGKSGQYVLYIAITVVCLIIWKFFL
jgi:hydrogenase-4 component B